MATSVLGCGFECGASAATGHVSTLTNASFSTTTVRTGLRSLRVNPTVGQGSALLLSELGTPAVVVWRYYLNVASAPLVSTVGGINVRNASNTRFMGLAYNTVDGKWYPGEDDGTTCTLGSTGATLSAGWHRIDCKVNVSANPWTIDVQVDGTALTQLTRAIAATTLLANMFGGNGLREVSTYDYYLDDRVVSVTAGDYPLGGTNEVEIISYVPNADGTHNIAGAADFYGGTDATPKSVDLNGRTDAYTYIDERPLPTTSVDFINIVAPPNSTDYVEIQYEDEATKTSLLGVEAIFVTHDAGGAGTATYTVTLREHAGGTSATIFSGTQNVGTTITFRRAHFATVPGTADAWTQTKFSALRTRILASDASPDTYIDALMLEAAWLVSSVVPADLVLQSIDAVSSLPNLNVGTPQVALQSISAISSLDNLAVRTPANLVLQSVDALSSLNNLAVATPAQLTLQLIDAVSSLLNIAVTVPALIVLQSVNAISALTNVEIGTPLVTLQSIDAVSSLVNILITANAYLALQSIDAVSSLPNLNVGTPLITLQSIDALSSLNNVLIRANAYIDFQPVDIISALNNLLLTANALLSLGAVEGISSLPNIAITVPALITAQSVDAVSSLPNVDIITLASVVCQSIDGVSSLLNLEITTPSAALVGRRHSPTVAVIPTPFRSWLRKRRSL